MAKVTYIVSFLIFTIIFILLLFPLFNEAYYIGAYMIFQRVSVLLAVLVNSYISFSSYAPSTKNKYVVIGSLMLIITSFVLEFFAAFVSISFMSILDFVEKPFLFLFFLLQVYAIFLIIKSHKIVSQSPPVETIPK